MGGLKYFGAGNVSRTYADKMVLDYFTVAGGPFLSNNRIMGIIMMLLIIHPAFTGYSQSIPGRDSRLMKEGTKFLPPNFDETVNTDISVLLGQPVYLSCTVNHLGDKLISWIRTKDLHILTSGKHTFTADQRVDVLHTPESDTWTLKIKNSKITDSGKYECQVNTDPKMNMFFTLTVSETLLKDSPSPPDVMSAAVKASISGPREQYANVGFTVTFECKVFFKGGLEKDKYHPRFYTRSVPNIQWLHEGLAVSFQAERGGISVETERGERSGSSRLTVASVGPRDAGRYTCMGTNIAPDTVTLHVVEGEHTEAMQRDQASGASHSKSPAAYRFDAKWGIPFILSQMLATYCYVNSMLLN